jgi:hypothetical protein
MSIVMPDQMQLKSSFAEQKNSVLHGSMQNQAGPKNMCKKTRETCAGQRSIGGGSGGYLVC